MYLSLRSMAEARLKQSEKPRPTTLSGTPKKVKTYKNYLIES